MKKTAIFILLAALASCGAPTEKEASPAMPADTTAKAPEPAPEAPPKLDSATQAKLYMEYMTPGDMHKMLAAMDGKWTEEITMWMDPSAPPSKSMGMCENKMVMGGRYQLSTHKSEIMGMQFEGSSTLGYDNAKKIFVSSWVDNMGTGIMTMEGTYDAGTKTISFKGKCTDATTGKDCAVREEFKIVDDKNQVMEMYMTPAGGKEMKSMEIKFAKK